jgi:SIR2-like domain
MGIQVMEVSRQRQLAEHLAAAHQLPDDELEGIRKLALQIHGEQLLPVVGAGSSWDCGVRLAGEIAVDLHAAYLASAEFAPHDVGLDKKDLAGIAEAIYLHTNQSRVVSEVGIPNADLWLPAEKLGGHFCVYCVFARMVREGLLKEAFGFNYDCGVEAGLTAEGFAYGKVLAGRRWVDRARIVADAEIASDTKRDESSFTLFKANGCAVRYRELATGDEPKAAEGIVIRREQLEEWKDSAWSRDKFRDRAGNHILMLVGFSAQDTKFTTQVRQVLENVYAQSPANGSPRVVAIDIARNATPIESMIASGLGGAAPEDSVTKICIEGSTATAALLVLLSELLAIELSEELEEVGVELSEELDARLATLTISTPAMLRWSYLAGAPRADELIQRANQIAAGGYVPHTYDPALSARLIKARRQLRERIGHVQPESSVEALANHGFTVDGAFAYMPVGIPIAELEQTCREGAELEVLRYALAKHYPRNLECVLLAGTGERLEGVNLATGKRITND